MLDEASERSVTRASQSMKRFQTPYGPLFVETRGLGSGLTDGGLGIHFPPCFPKAAKPSMNPCKMVLMMGKDRSCKDKDHFPDQDSP